MDSVAPAAVNFIRKPDPLYERVLFDNEDRKLIASLSREYEDELGVSFVVIKGFIRIAVRRWQVDIEMTVHELRTLSFDEQRPHCKRIDEDFFAQLSSAIADQEQKDALKQLVGQKPMMIALLKNKHNPSPAQ